MPEVTSLDQIFNHIDQRFQPDKAEGVNAVYQFDLTGANSGKYWVKVANQTAEAQAGEHPDPTMVLTAAGDDFIALVNGKLNPMMAFMQGKIKVKGEMGLALKLQAILGF